MLIKFAKNQALCTLRIPFDIIVNTFFLTMGLTQSVLGKNTVFFKYAHNSSPRGSPDMILTAFDVKFHEQKNEIPPGACRPPYASNYSILGILALT